MTIVCDKREFHCHKFMLAARSEVFAAMLRHEFLEKQNSRVDVKEIDAETMELLLNYIYTGRVSDFKSVSVVELFKVIKNLKRMKIRVQCWKRELFFIMEWGMGELLKDKKFVKGLTPLFLG